MNALKKIINHYDGYKRIAASLKWQPSNCEYYGTLTRPSPDIIPCQKRTKVALETGEDRISAEARNNSENRTNYID
ncbi:MAG: hypothetical protein PUE12_03360 [Oscillospiraceae bacterium]|nr:hypothetical protein [Oscillospiraceae bacterium]